MKYHSQKKKGKQINLRRTFIFLLLIIALVALWEGIDLFLNRNKIFSGISASGISVGGLKKEEVPQALQPVINKIINSPRVLVLEEEGFKFIPAVDLGAKIDLAQEMDRLYQVARSGNLFTRMKDRFIARKNGYNLNLKVKFDNQKLKDLEKNIVSMVERAPRDAYLEGNYIRESQEGIKVNLEELEKEIINSLNSWNEEEYYLHIPLTIIPAQYNTEDLLKELGIAQELSIYSTPLQNRDGNTIYNIKLASEKINGRIVKLGEVFSFNQIVGPAEKEDGFKEGTIIANGKFVNGYGGGVCQVSSTLYNSVLLANLLVIERYNHSIYGEATTYVPLGRDAAVFYGFKDLKFKNNLSDTIAVFARVSGGMLTVSIYGYYPDKPEIEIISKDKKVIDYQVIREKEPGLDKGQEITIQEGIPGYQIKTYRIIKKDEGEKIELLSNDAYNNVPMIIKEN